MDQVHVCPSLYPRCKAFIELLQYCQFHDIDNQRLRAAVDKLSHSFCAAITKPQMATLIVSLLYCLLWHSVCQLNRRFDHYYDTVNNKGNLYLTCIGKKETKS